MWRLFFLFNLLSFVHFYCFFVFIVQYSITERKMQYRERSRFRQSIFLFILITVSISTSNDVFNACASAKWKGRSLLPWCHNWLHSPPQLDSPWPQESITFTTVHTSPSWTTGVFMCPPIHWAALRKAVHYFTMYLELLHRIHVF